MPMRPVGVRWAPQWVCSGHNTVHVEARAVASLLPLSHGSRNQIRFPGLCSKYLYLLSHLFRVLIFEWKLGYYHCHKYNFLLFKWSKGRLTLFISVKTSAKTPKFEHVQSSKWCLMGKGRLIQALNSITELFCPETVINSSVQYMAAMFHGYYPCII